MKGIINLKRTFFYLLLIIGSLNLSLTAQTLYTFNYTGGPQNWTVPPCVTSITVTLKGGKGGGTGGGNGSTVSGVLAVTPGQVIQVRVGGQGTCPGSVYAGGGPSATQPYAPYQPCGGGGYSGIFIGGAPVAIAAGGGGNAGGDMGGSGGAGGCATGGAGTSPFGQAGQGGTQTSGGAGGPPWTAGGGSGTAGSYLQGGTGGNDLQYGNAAGGGGGGGYYGGGGGGSDNISGTSFIGGGGGGGGSSLTPGGWACGAGNNTGPGQVTILASVGSSTIAVNSATICPGQTAVLTASGNTTYTWQPGGSNANPFSVSPGVTTTYTVTGGSAGCTASITTQVVVNPLPNPVALSNSPVCINKPINFTGSGGTTYTWTGPAGFTSNAQNPSITGATAGHAGTYTLGVTNANGCVNYTTITVVVNPLPVIAVTNPTACVGNNINLSANGGSTYSWNGPNGYTSNLQNPVITNATTGMTGAYNVTVTSAQGCTNTAVSNVSVTPLPVPNILSNSPVCAGSTLSFTGSGGNSYNWTGPNGFSSTLQNPTIGGVTTAASGTYSLVVTVGTCTNITTAPVVINPLPVPTAVNNGPICQGQTLILTGGGGTTYTWTGPGSYASNASNPNIANATAANAGTYSLSVTNANGCINSTVTTVVVNPLPLPVVNNPTACVGTNISLTATGGNTYSWSGPNAYTSNQQNPVITNATTGMSGAYNVTVTSAQGCTATAIANVSVITLPLPNIISNSPVCVGATLSFTGSGGNSYSWTGPNGFSSTLQNPNIAGVSIAAGGTYSLVVTVGTCTNSTTTAVVINPLPNPSAVNNGPVCENQTINLTGGGGTSYSWTGPGGFSSTNANPSIPTASVANAGTYTLTVTNANSCVNSTVTTVVVNTLPIVTVTHPTVCLNTTINLSANGGATYAWSGPSGFTSGLQNPVINNAAFSHNGVYTVTVTSAQGCTSTANSTVTVLALPVAAISNNTPCAGATLTFTGSGGAGYNWSGPNGFFSTLQNPNISNVTLAANGVYTLVVTAGTCSSSATQSVTVNALPNPTAGSNSPVCENQTINLTAGGGTSYAWSGPSGFTSAIQNPVINTAATSHAGTYSVVVTDGNSCSSSTVTTLVVNTLPVISVSNPTVCLGQSINLTANGGATYNWSGPNSFTSAQQNPVILNSTSQMSGVYTVTVTSAQNCTASAQSTVTVLPLPAPAIVTNTPCVGGVLQLTASGGSSYLWTGPNGFNSMSSSPNINNVTLAAGGTYTLIAAVGNCTNSTTGQITINPLPTPNITGNSPVCLNAQANMNVSGGTSAVWSGPNGFTSTTSSVTISSASMSNNGVYTATVTDANGCSNSTTYNFVVNPLPVIAMVGSTVCANQNISLSANGGVTYSWTGPQGFTSGVAQPVITGASPQMSGTYTVTVTDANGCVSSSVTGVQVNTLPTPTAVSNSPVCLTKTITLASGALTAQNYAWAGPNGFTSFAQNLAITNAQLNHTGTYTVTATDNLGCAGTATVAVIVNTPPEGSVFADKTAGCAPFCVTFSSAASASIQSCLWDLGIGLTASGTSVTRCYEKDGPYNITAFFTDANGCSSTSSFSIVVYPKPTADFNFAPQRPVENEQVDFTNSSFGAGITSYEWQFSSQSNSVITQQNPTMIFDKPGGYLAVLIVTNDKGCTDTVMRPVLVGEDYGLYVPEAFTPNGDGINDVFFPKGFGIVTYEMNIFDRWGERLFTTNKFDEGWKGNFDGRGDNICQDGVYVWHIKLTNVFGKAIELTGKVVLYK